MNAGVVHVAALDLVIAAENYCRIALAGYARPLVTCVNTGDGCVLQCDCCSGRYGDVCVCSRCAGEDIAVLCLVGC